MEKQNKSELMRNYGFGIKISNDNLTNAPPDLQLCNYLWF